MTRLLRLLRLVHTRFVPTFLYIFIISPESWPAFGIAVLYRRFCFRPSPEVTLLDKKKKKKKKRCGISRAKFALPICVCVCSQKGSRGLWPPAPKRALSIFWWRLCALAHCYPLSQTPPNFFSRIWKKRRLRRGVIFPDPMSPSKFWNPTSCTPESQQNPTEFAEHLVKTLTRQLHPRKRVSYILSMFRSRDLEFRAKMLAAARCRVNTWTQNTHTELFLAQWCCEYLPSFLFVFVCFRLFRLWDST